MGREPGFNIIGLRLIDGNYWKLRVQRTRTLFNFHVVG